ncbi:MAG: 6-bladed beta-propeller [Candidatus Aminicenantes bacterium]|nr:MAG: 6-bladed beta-propeller [Candidatus Aminicenantes bacterium]
MKSLSLILKFSLVFFISSLVFSYSLQTEDIKIKIINGVPTVYNPKVPASLQKIVLKEDLVISGEKEGVEYTLSDIRSVQVDEEEIIYVLDLKDVRVKVFDKNGKGMRIIGKKGQGPGELQLPYRMYLISGKELMFYDISNRRISYYSLDGKCLREISTRNQMFERTMTDSKGYIIGYFFIPGEMYMHELKKFDSKLNPVMTLVTIEEKRTPYVIEMLDPTLQFRLMENDNIAWSHPSSYEIFIVSPEGKTLRKIVKDHDSVRITEAEKKKMIEGRTVPPEYKIELPEYYNPLYYFICDEDGRIYVRTYERDNKGGFYYDVFDSEGRNIAKFSIPGNELLFVVKKNKMYAVMSEDGNEFSSVKRYSVEWQ